ncbi:Flagellar hook-length control protein FliK [Rhodopirellula islandica]|uniref:Flagellar hook-length control protein FliK n=1 Tax=Rhodopirellula islandica TaxID=595434 RepID=A0A0J1BHZ2_RHOIS|nr:flagellar hook-length control protein FliK [Rhodopirellula islandica]KLU06152.1 Flagellar hook-length control protein FliK [Rhodopirellula islandica]
MTTTKPVQSRTETTVSTPTTNKRAENAFAALGSSASARTAGLIEPASGLGDPFAEVFARIATTETVVASEPASAPEDSLSTETEDRDESSEEEVEARDDTTPAAAATTATNLVDETVEVDSAQDAVATSNEENESSESPDEVAWTQSAEETDSLQEEEASSADEALLLSDAESKLEESDSNAIVTEEVAVLLSSESQQRSSDDTANASAEEEVLTTNPVTSTEEAATDESGTENDNAETRGESQSDDPTSHDPRRTERRRYSREGNADSQDQASQPASGSNSGEGKIAIDSSLAAAGDETEISETQLNQLVEQAAAKSPASVAAVAPIQATAAAAAAKTAASGTTAVGSTSAAVSTPSGSSDPTDPLHSATPSAEKAESKAKAGLQASGVDQTSAVARAKLVQRVSRGFQTLGTNGGHIRMRLSPVELGSVQLEVHIQENNLRGRMVTESEAASQLLREHLPQLRSQLESQGMRLESIEITTEPNGASEFDQTQNSFGDRDHADRDAGSQHERSRNRGNVNGSRPIDAKPDGPTLPAATAASWMTPATGVDLQV